MRMRRGGGVTIMEALISFLVMAIVLGFVADLCGGYMKITRRTSATDASMMRREALQTMKREMEEAVPAAGTSEMIAVTSRGVSFWKVSPVAFDRLPATAPATPPASWNLYDREHMTQVDYAIVQDRIIRRAGPADTDGQRINAIVLRDIREFRAMRMPSPKDALVTINVLFNDGESLTTTARLRSGYD
jgi:type II secretory pathway pseudopilin PulG